MSETLEKTKQAALAAHRIQFGEGSPLLIIGIHYCGLLAGEQLVSQHRQKEISSRKQGCGGNSSTLLYLHSVVTLFGPRPGTT